MLTLQDSSNALIRRNLVQSDQVTPLLLSSCASIVVQLLRGTRVVATYTLGTSPEVRQGLTTSQLEVEVKSSLTQTEGTITMEVLITITDSEFEVDLVNKQKFSEDIIKII